MRQMNFLLVLLFSAAALEGHTQSSCPLGYELRNVKCLNSPSVTQTCVPINYTCNACWQVEWPHCKDDGKGYENASTYEDALKIANDRIKNMKSCDGAMGLDYNNYRIFIAGGDYCKTPNPSNNNSSNNKTGNLSVGSQSTSNNNTNSSTSSNNQNGNGNRDLQLQAEIKFFYVKHHNAEEKLEEIKNKYPANAVQYENNYRAKLQQLLNSVKSEDAKSNPSLETVKEFRSQLDKLMEQMASAETLSLNNSNAQKIQQQQYEKKADNYLNQAQNTNQSTTSQQLNLDLAKTNAIMSGNSQQVAEINKQQTQLNEKTNQQLINSSTNLLNAISQYSADKAQKRQRQELFRSKKENNFHLGLNQILNNRIGDLYLESYDRIEKDQLTLRESDPSDWTYKIVTAKGYGKFYKERIENGDYDFTLGQIGNSSSQEPYQSSESWDLAGIAFSRRYSSLGNGLYYEPDNKGRKYYNGKMKDLVDGKLKAEEALPLAYLHYEERLSQYALEKPKDYNVAFKIFKYVPDHNAHPYFTKLAYFFMGIIKKAEAKTSGDSAILNEAIEYLNKAYNINDAEFVNGISQYIVLKDYSYLFQSEEYYWTLQLSIMEELVAAFSIKAKTDKNAYIQAVNQYIDFGNQYFNHK
jgi:hypothetical protein